MIVVADASVLVGELLRKRGRELLLRLELQVLVAEDQWSETPTMKYLHYAPREGEADLVADALAPARPASDESIATW